MIPTTDYIRSRFASFNATYFDGKLPEPQFCVRNSRTVLGRFSYRRKRKWLFGRYRITDYAIMVSSYYDMEASDLDNILLHEMIHFYIAYRNLRDTSTHGRLFHREMERLNACGWNINVTTSTRRMTVTERNRKLFYIVLAIVTTDGRYFLTVANQKYIARMDDMAARSSLVQSHVWYISVDEFFASFPLSRSLRGRSVSHEEFEQRVESMMPLEESFALSESLENDM